MAINNTSTNINGSSSMFETFGNENKQVISQSTLIQYLENSTVNFPLPEASTSILAALRTDDQEVIDPMLLDQVIRHLIIAGFEEANAKAMADILMQTAKKQGVNPLTYFEMNDYTLQLTNDTYKVLNALMPAGNRIGLVAPKVNSNNKQVYTAK